MLEPAKVAAIAAAAEAELRTKGLSLPPLSDAEKAALRSVEAPLVSAEGVFLKAFVGAACARIPLIGEPLAAIVGGWIDQGLALERAELDKALA